MELHALCIRRPVLTTVLALIISILGLIGVGWLGVREYPVIESPVISVLANYPGATAEVVEAQVTDPIEEAVNTVAGIRRLTSVSRDGASRIRIEFELGTDLDAAANDVRDQVGRAVRLLPRDVDPPSISKADADGGFVLTLALRGEGWDLMALTAVAERVKERLQTVPEVGAVELVGEKVYAMRLRLDPERMAAHGVTALDIAAAVRRESVELPGGRIENPGTELTVQAAARLAEPEDFNQLAVRASGGREVRFREVGRAELAPLNERLYFTVNGEQTVGLRLRAQPGANQIAIVDEAVRRLPSIRAGLPAGVTLDVVSDNTRFVRRALLELWETIAVALVLVVAVTYLFLGSWRATVVPAVVIPISLLGAVFLMFAAGFSLNVLTLLGLVLAVGLVVDDAIVVVENIHRRRAEGRPLLEAGLEGTREVFVAVVATSLALMVVFAPIFFLPGTSGRLFREFALVIAGAVAVSALIALTLTPMMTSRIEPGEDRGWLLRGFEAMLRQIRLAYERSLGWVLRRAWLAPAVLVGAGAATVVMYLRLPQELAPLEDRNQIAITATGPEGASFEYMLGLMRPVAVSVAERVPEAETITLQVPGSGARSGTGVTNTALLEVLLRPRQDRMARQQEIAARLSTHLRSFPGARFSVSQEPSVGDRRGGNAVQFVLRAAEVPALRAALPTFLERVGEAPGLASAEVDLRFTRPELRVALERERLEALGVSAIDVAQTLQSSLSGQRVGTFPLGGRQYEVVQTVADEFRTDPAVLPRLLVRGTGGQAVPLDNLVEIGEGVAAPQLYRFDRQAAATVTARLAPGTTLAAGVATMEELGRDLPDGVATDLTGAAAEFVESRRGLLVTFALALLLVYLVLAAQFENWLAPLVILLTVPLALSGALGALMVTGQTINLFSQIGMVMLVGLVTKNGILLVEFALQRHHAGAGWEEAVRNAADLRLRPILMTTTATVLGTLPIALALGAGAESRISLGVAVIGGLTVGTVLTLYVIPALALRLPPPPRPLGFGGEGAREAH